MSRNARAAGLVLALVAGFLILAGGPAYAAPELRLTPESGPPGSTFLVTGTGFAPTEVVIHWEDESGPVLARPIGPDFMVEVTVPADAPPDSHPVMAVVTDGASVSTSSASFQVTGSEPVETTTSTSTTVEVPVDTTEPTTVTTPAPSAGGTGVSRVDSVSGGVDGGMADTTGGEGGADRAGQTGGAAGSTGGAAGGSGGTTTTAGPGTGAGVGTGGTAGAPGSPPPGAGDVGAAPGGSGRQPAAPNRGGEDASGSALAPRPASQSSGILRSPLLLVGGLGLVFAAGVILAVRNRHRTSGPPAEPGA